MKKNRKGKFLSSGLSGDSLSVYLKDINKTPLLTREEEVALAHKTQTGDAEALKKMVEANLRFVVKIARRYQGCGLSLLDLIDEGNIGLIEAAKRFDWRKNTKFITYAVWWIRQAIMQALAEQGGAVRLPIRKASMASQIRGRGSRLNQELGREPTNQEIAQLMNISLEELEELMGATSGYTSLDAPIKDEEGITFADLLPADDHHPVDSELLLNAFKAEVANLLQELDPRERQILEMRYGIGDYEPMTLEDIGKKLKVSRERIRQIEEKAKRRLSRFSKARQLRDFLN
jgi:RNA polymerase primary sigma factor